MYTNWQITLRLVADASTCGSHWRVTRCEADIEEPFTLPLSLISSSKAEKEHWGQAHSPLNPSLMHVRQWRFKLSLPACVCPQDLSYKDRHWHDDCFHCFRCHRSLVDKPFSTKDEQLLCTECYSNEYSSKCYECKKTIMPGKWNICLSCSSHMFLVL